MKYPTYEDVKKARETLRDISTEHWFHGDLLTWQWWLLLAATILPWIIWVKFRDKKRTYELLSYGLTWAVMASLLDIIGGEMLLWGYPHKLFPMVPPLFPADITVIPVAFMFIYQYTNKYKTYLFSSILLSAFFSFIVEALFIKWGMFELTNWKHTFSFIGFSIIAQIIFYIIKRLKENE
ncbi:CBO0543 family protein [Neobacillus kokaensis]|uniref:Permease n=1 Tax=Neobacillus kokaensis TaxID=2759023 RepID=A0ABQ3N4C2_9BACI|nr:CBO0543 family protein [Neobacillus kokaensis]GHH99489.1 hypothetical protein AM1BK_30320 [Neobacillus kokaensis]